MNKAESIGKLFIDSQMKKKLKDIFFEFHESKLGFYYSVANDFFNQSYLNERYRGDLFSFYKEYLFHYEMFKQISPKISEKLKKQVLINSIMKINADNINRTDIVYYDVNEDLEITINKIKASFKSSFVVFRDYLQFFNIELENLNSIIFFRDLNKSNLIDIKLNLHNELKNGFTNIRSKKKRISKYDFLKLINDILCSDLVEDDNQVRIGNFNCKEKLILDYLGIEKLILNDPIIKRMKIDKNIEFKQEEIRDYLKEEDYNKNYSDFSSKINKNTDSIAISTEKMSLDNLKIFKEEIKNIHNLLKFYSSNNILFKSNQNPEQNKFSPSISFYQKNSFRSIQTETYGFRSIKINCGPGQILFIGIPAEFRNKILEITLEKFSLNILEGNFESFPELNFFLRNNLKFNIFILKEGDLLNIEPGVFYM